VTLSLEKVLAECGGANAAVAAALPAPMASSRNADSFKLRSSAALLPTISLVKTHLKRPLSNIPLVMVSPS
jgi:hypothetical protein